MQVSSVMQPIPTNIPPRLKKLKDVRAVIIDIYGTLVISGTGEVGTADENDVENQLLRREIERVNSARNSETNPRPEVEILDVWRRVLTESNRNDLANDPHEVARIAGEFENRTNPTGPMPGGAEVLLKLQSLGMKLGIVSNAQFYTITLIESVIGGPLERRFERDLCYFSNRYRASKPGTLMFDRLVESLVRMKLRPEQAVYVGNDMLNDVYAAKNAGLQTALFAADARSLRLREDHPACGNLSSDVVLTRWDQLLECL